MKKMCKALALTLCTIMLLSTFAVFADSGDDNVLTLEEAKKLALDNNLLYEHQQSYIDQSQENYEDVYDNNTGSSDVDLDSIADEVEYLVGRKIAIEAAALETRTEVFKRNNLKRTSDYEVTVAYYDVISANYALDDARIDMELKTSDLDVAKLKRTIGQITDLDLASTENALKASQITYNNTFAELQNNMQTLGRLIGRNLDIYNDKLDMALILPDTASIDLNKVKEDYMKYNDGFFQLQENVGIAEYRLDLTQEKYDYYYKKLNNKKSSRSIRELTELLSDYEQLYDDAVYQLDQKEKDLDITLASAYTGLKNLMDTMTNLQKNVQDTKTTVELNKLKYEQGMISKIDLQKSEAALKNLENRLNTTITSVNTQYTSLMQYSEVANAMETAEK